ncbi:MAG: amidase [Chloroflexi bacterium]|nr:amidase [Chloroflexota bacterium]
MEGEDELEEATIAGLQVQLGSGELTARQLVERLLERIEAIDHSGPTLRSVIEVNPDVINIADALDRERAERGPRGPLHGIPILLKDNIDTADRMQTTAGSLALLGIPVSQDATAAKRLRDAGAILLGKSNLSEWANFRSTRSSGGWSGRGRQTRNPYVLDRNPGGSSSGSAVAVSANLVMAALGTETDGSIMSPSSVCGVVGIKPTVGRTSRAGVIPISHSQDSVGPHARTVADAAMVLAAIIGPDGRDPATSSAPALGDLTGRLDPEGLRGARIGVLRKLHTGLSEHADKVFEESLAVLRGCRVELVDEVEIPGEADLRENFGDSDVRAEMLVMEYEFKAGIEAYLATRPGAEARTLADLIRFNEEHAAEEMPYFGQERWLSAAGRGPLTDELYLKAREQSRQFRDGLTEFFREQRFDALVLPTNAPPPPIDLLHTTRPLGVSGAQAAAVAGFPLITVPAGFVFDLLPIGLTFLGPAWSEMALIRFAFAFEQANPVRRPPRFVRTTADLP